MVDLNINQRKALEFIKNHKNIFLTGSPGTGKSYTLKAIIRYFKDNHIDYAVTSSTGCSAVLINGQTIHSFIGLGINYKDCEKIVKRLHANKIKVLKTIKYLIIDEISMLDDFTFEIISNVLKLIKNNKLPFGGICMILVGDFCQLSPVNGDYCFKSEEWKKLNLQNIILKDIIRQQNDIEFQNILQEVRFGKCSISTFNKLQALKNTKFNNIKPTKLYSLTSQVDDINNFEYSKLYESKYCKNINMASVIECYPSVVVSDIDYELFNIDDYKNNEEGYIYRYNAISNDKNIKIKDYNINLYEGLQVMVTRNICLEKGLINGTLGKIINLSQSFVSIIDENNKTHTIYYHKDTNENNNTFIKFMPIKLAYSLSIHKSQGATLDAIEIDGGIFIFAPGQLYTAISRARYLQNIKIINIDKHSFICNKDVKKFYNTISEEESI